MKQHVCLKKAGGALIPLALATLALCCFFLLLPTANVAPVGAASPDLNQWLQEAVVKHAPPAVGGRRIKIRYITQPSARPPTFIAFCSRPDEVPRSYLRYLTNSLRDAFDLPGVPIRLNLRKGENPYAPSKRRNR